MWVLFLDSFVGKEEADDVPIPIVHQKMNEIIESVKEASGESSLDFNCFRLSIFTTLVSGIGIPEPGKHLHQFFFPTVGMASYKHILNPSPQLSSSADFANNWKQIDGLMKQLSHRMNLTHFRRDYTEVHMCESVPGRYLEKQDLFVVGQDVFENNTDGVACFKEYGSKLDWVPILRDILRGKKNLYNC